jgi:hypothetical protein
MVEGESDIIQHIESVDWSVGTHEFSQEETDKIILELGVKHMDGVKELTDMKVENMSGYSKNPTWSVANLHPVEGSDKPKCLVVKFYQNERMNFRFDSIAYMVLHKQGVCPRLVDVSGNYRAVEMVDARQMTQIEYLNPKIVRNLIESICDYNYNPLLTQYWRKYHGEETLTDRVFKPAGWMDAVYKKRVAEEWKIEC